MRPAGTSPLRSRALAPPASACSDVVPRYLCPHPTSWALPRSHRSITSAEDSIIGRSATRRCSPEEDGGRWRSSSSAHDDDRLLGSALEVVEAESFNCP